MRVTAIQSFKNGVIKTYGDGELLGDKVPNAEPFRSAELPNPCIKMDSGKYVWGFQCWWGPVYKVKEKHAPHTRETIIVEPEENILPVDEIEQ